jgi:hypothetical protein
MTPRSVLQSALRFGAESLQSLHEDCCRDERGIVSKSDV